MFTTTIDDRCYPTGRGRLRCYNPHRLGATLRHLRLIPISLWCKSGYVGKNLCGIHKLRS